MGACFLYGQTGGGAGKVKTLSGAVLPDSPTKNALWVQSDTAVTDYIFSPLQPGDAGNGCVWLKTIGEGVNYILDKDQKLRFNLNDAYQYVDGSWKPVAVFLGTDSGWKEIVSIRIYLYNAGDQCTGLTGGWEINNHSGSAASLQATYISFGPKNSTDVGTGNNYCQIRTKKIVYVPNGYTKLCAQVNLTGNKYGFEFGLGTGFQLSGGNYKVSAKLSSGKVGEYTMEVDVSGYVNQNVANALFDSISCGGRISKVWLGR